MARERSKKAGGPRKGAAGKGAKPVTKGKRAPVHVRELGADKSCIVHDAPLLEFASFNWDESNVSQLKWPQANKDKAVQALKRGSPIAVFAGTPSEAAEMAAWIARRLPMDVEAAYSQDTYTLILRRHAPLLDE